MNFRINSIRTGFATVMAVPAVILFAGILNAQTRVEEPKVSPFQTPKLIQGLPGPTRPGIPPKGFHPGINLRPKDRQAQPSVSQGLPSRPLTSAGVSRDIQDAEIIEPTDGIGSDEIAINFESVDLMSLVRYLSQETGRGFVINQPLQGNVTIVSPVTLGKEEALAMLESILQVRGYTAVASGKMYKIVSLSDAKVAGTETRTSEKLESLTDDDTLITQIVPLERTSIEEASKILQNLLPKDVSMLLFAPSNTIVLTGRSVNIKRALEVLNEIEKSLLKPGLDIVPLKFSSAENMKAQLERIISTIGVEREDIRGGVNFLADSRSNSLLVLTSPDNFDRIRSLIDRLDTSNTDSRPELTRFFQLKYADETDTAKQIEDILGFMKKDQTRTATESAMIETTRLVPIRRTRSIMVTARSEDIMTRIESLLEYLDAPPASDTSDVKVIKIVNADAKTLAETLSRLVQQRAQGAETDKKQIISFVAEEHTNSLIITGPPQLFAHYENIVKTLDTMRHQILVEVLIAEVSGQLTHSLGIEWNLFDMDSSKSRAFGGTSFGLNTNPLTGTGLQIGLVQDPLNSAKIAANDVVELTKIKAMVKTYSSNSNFNILSAPQILTTDNEEAKISVGEVVALPQGFTQDRDTGRFDLTNFKYEDVGIVLKLTPRVNSNELVTLKIDQEIKKRQEENLYEFNVPVLTKRQMDTTITVPNGKTIVIGGLMREDKSKIIERVPLFSSIPIIGEAFKNRRTVTNKTNLLIFITPHILSTPEEVIRFDSDRTASAEVTDESKARPDAAKRQEYQSNTFRDKAKKAFEMLRTEGENR